MNHHDNSSQEAFFLQPNTFDVLLRRKRIIMVQGGRRLDLQARLRRSEIFRELADYGPRDLRGQADQIQQKRPGAEELRGHDRDPGMAHLPLKDLAAVEKAQRQWAKLVEVEVKF